MAEYLKEYLKIILKLFESFKDTDVSKDSESWVRFMKNWEFFNDKYNSKLLDALIEVIFRYVKGELKGRIKE